MQKKIVSAFQHVFSFKADSFSPVMSENGDFFRLYLDYCTPGKNRELAVYGNEQPSPKVAYTERGYEIVYDGLIAEDGSRHDIRLTLFVSGQEDGSLAFSFEICNDSLARVNEVQYPLFDFERIEGDFEKDVLYLPDGLGRRVINPHLDTQLSHTEYMAADYVNIVKMYKYPGQLSMPWAALKSGKHTMYLAAHSKIWRQLSIITETEPREETHSRFIIGIASYPAVVPGETLAYDGFTLALFDGDWREGASLYRKWAESEWLSPIAHKKSIEKLNGWQRIIMKHQFGEIYCKYDDLPRLYRAGKKYGINMILLFAWWEEGMDNGYPNYMPADDLGGKEALTRAIKTINDEGGQVILYANGHIIDISTEYYKTEGYKYTTKDIDLNDYREHYMFSNSGTILKMGNKSFAAGCYGTTEWPEKIMEIEKRHLALGSNGTFFDQLGCGFYLCFDNTHSHGNRIDIDPELRLPTAKKIHESLNEDQWFGTEWVIDRMSPHVDFTHGCGCGMTYTKDAYPYLFRYAFPEIITSNRFIHDEKKGWKNHLNYAFVFGLIYDVAIYRCRSSLENAPGFGEYVKKLVDMRREHLNHFIYGKFDTPSIDLPDKVWGAEYSYGGETVLALWNDTEADFTLPSGRDAGKILKPGDVQVFYV
ncbi:MAG: hypothetical protein IKJ65_12775 [Clostridia bacterium]|nr:hypothetical protein [Clostridia bacterium]